MTDQLNVFDTPLSRYAGARSTDPSTSKAAAASIKAPRASHRRVIAMFVNYGDMTDETLGTLLEQSARETGFKQMSPSGVRSRRSELSKPNMDRLNELAQEMRQEPFESLDIHEQLAARNQLRREGFRGVDGNITYSVTLWDTGKREKLSTGRLGIVWGIAR